MTLAFFPRVNGPLQVGARRHSGGGGQFTTPGAFGARGGGAQLLRAHWTIDTMNVDRGVYWGSVIGECVSDPINRAVY